MAQPAFASESNPKIGIPAAILLLAVLLLGYYCCELNAHFYQHHHPFYDSLSYNEKLFRVMTISRESGFGESLKKACFENNTNCLPFLISAAVAGVVSPSRFVGIWIQTGLLYLFLVSLLHYLVRFRKLRPTTALAGCLSFLAAKCLYFPNGGLSDFRMDLSLLLAFGMTCVWFLISMSKPTTKHFLFLGTSAAIACLFRATAPIYLLFALGPLCVIELARAEQRTRKAMGLLIATLTVVVLAGWFFFLNFEYLKFYYVDWNTDANAKIPWVEALHHWKLAQRSVGEPLVLMILCWIVATMVFVGRTESVGNWVTAAWRDREIDWRIAWLAISPVVLMIARRAGLNPFVCMPAVFGLVLFFTLPCLKQIDRLNEKTLTRFCWTILVICVALALGRAWHRHSLKGFDTMAAQNQLIDAMVDDATQEQKTQIRFGIMQLTDLDSNSLYSTLLFDRRDAKPGLDSICIGELEIRRVATFSRPAALDWEILDGDTNEEKFDYLIADANRRIDYLILPDKQSANNLQTSAAHNYINRYLVELRKRIVDDPTWSRIGPPISTNETETVEIYRKQR